MKRSRIPGFGQIARQTRNAWRNRGSVGSLIALFLNDDLHPWSVKVLRRFLARGHAASARAYASIDSAGRPIPWYPYALCDYLDDLDTSSWQVVESGSGNSTLYWSSKCAKILALEEDESWRRKMSMNLPKNVVLLPGENEASVAQAKELCPKPQLVVIDGHDRSNMAELFFRSFSSGPLYLVDNSDWLLATTCFLRGAGLIEIRFKGPGAANTFHWSSSLFVSPHSLALLSQISAENRVQGGLPAGSWESDNSHSAD